MQQRFEVSIEPPVTAGLVDAWVDLSKDAPSPKSSTVRNAIGNEEPVVETSAVGNARSARPFLGHSIGRSRNY